VNQEHQEPEIDAAQNSVDRNLFDPTAMDPEIHIKPHRQMSIATPAVTPAEDSNSAPVRNHHLFDERYVC
jgi:hypothetical protein